MSNRPVHFGAIWWKFDPHSHSPASNDYGKGPDQDALKGQSPREWLLNAMSREIDCVAITDHNSGKWVDPLKAELAQLAAAPPAGYRPLVLFPGVEISVHGGVHVIAIFDPSADSDSIVRLLSSCGYRGAYGNTDDCTEKSCSEVIELIHQEGGIAVLAHADKPSGLFEMQSGVTLRQSLRAEGLLAVELIERNFALPQIYVEQNLRLASIVGSDSHHPPKVGTRFTWVKMQKPSLEALRLALHDGEDGVRRCDESEGDPNDIGSRFYIQSIGISKGAKVGNQKELCLELSPWMTAIIGGRGSGKSSILDFLRIALGRSDGMPQDTREEFERFNCVPRGRGDFGMLRDETTIALNLVKDCRQMRLTWSGQGKWEQLNRDESGNWNRAEEVGDVAKRFPVRIFSQKQLYEMTKESAVLLNLIDERWDRRAWMVKRESLADQWLENRRDLRQNERELLDGRQARADLADVRAKMQLFEASGTSDVLAKYQENQTTSRMLDAKRLAISTARDSIAALETRLPTLAFDSTLKEALGESSADALGQVFEEYEVVRGQLLAQAARFAELANRWDTISASMQWSSSLRETEQRYEALKEELRAAGGVDISGYPTLVAKAAELEAMVNGLEHLTEKNVELAEVGDQLLKTIEAHDRTLRANRRAVIESWRPAGSDVHVRVTLHDLGDTAEAEIGLRSIIRKNGDEFANDILRTRDPGESTGLLGELEHTPIEARWEKLRSIRSTLSNATYSEPLGLDRRFGRHLEQLRNSTPEDIDRLFLWTPEDKLQLELVRANGAVENIETGSAGQRTAGLLGLVLSLDDTPIIIDQPEDDLETRLISNLVVSSLRRLKLSQQVIVVTHNPNIPVNGAAEQIVEMRFSGGQINVASMGALQRQEIRRAVCEIMEGGKDALDKRYFRISQALTLD